MKKLLLSIALLSITFIITNTIRADEWAKTYGGSDEDWTFSIQETTGGGYITAGYTFSFGAGASNAWVVKLNSDGTISWEKSYGGSDYDWAYAIREISDPGYIVTGYTESFGAGGADAWLLKLNSTGDTVTWQKAYGGVESEEFYSVQEVTSGGYIAAGRTSSFGAGDSDAWVIKLDSAGAITWQNRYGSDDFDTANCIQETLDGGYIVAGDTWFTTTGVNYSVNSDIFVMKLDSSGTITWQKTYGDILDNDSVCCIKQTTDGGYIIAGDSRAFGGISNIWIIKIDSTGSISWQKTYGGTWSYASSIKETSDLDYIVAGYTYDYGAGASDFWVLKLEGEGINAGDIVWQKAYGGSNYDWAYSIQEASTSEYLVAGRTHSFGTGNDDAFILKLDINGDIPDCALIYTSTATATDTSITASDSSLTAAATTATVTDTTASSQNSSATVKTICPLTGEDTDGDGILDIADNCLNTPNGPNGGTCTSGSIGDPCTIPGNNESECGTGGFCSMNQEDSYPPQGNDIGDACECEGDFDCSGGVDASDVTDFLTDFGRTAFFHPCINADPCNGDFNCDVNVDATDVTIFLDDFGRGPFFNPCPACIPGTWCSY